MAARKDGCRSERAVQTASREPSRTGGGGGAGRKGSRLGQRQWSGGVGQAAGESRVKGRLLEARVEDPKSVETRKEIQVFRGMVAAITTHRAARTTKPSRRSDWDGTGWRRDPCCAAMLQRSCASGRASPLVARLTPSTVQRPSTQAASTHCQRRHAVTPSKQPSPQPRMQPVSRCAVGGRRRRGGPPGAARQLLPTPTVAASN